MSRLGAADVKSALDAAGFPVFYGDEDDFTEMPYIVFYESATISFHADGRTMESFGEFTAMLFCGAKSPDDERAVEDALDAARVPWTKDGDMRSAEGGWTRTDYTFPAWVSAR